MELTAFLKAYKAKNKLPLPDEYNRRVEACLAIQIHTTGARPAYDSSKGYIEPESYHKDFETLFKVRLLNRHPNESPSHYNWRLSVYSPVAKELYDKFANMCKGSILQPNNYTITADENTNEWLNAYNLDAQLAELLEFILQNPYGFIGVLSVGEYDSTEKAKVKIVTIKYKDVKMFDGETMAFMYNGELYYVDSVKQVKVEKNEVIETPHNFGRLTFWSYSNSFLQPYQFWSDSLVRNMNDDEAMVKHYSYPIVQVVEQECYSCHGNKQVIDTTYEGYDPHNPSTTCMKTCDTCNGKGTISRNPGDFYTISEETLARNGGTMQDLAKFITPDVGIPEYHLKRWQTFYERVEHSLYLRSVNEGVQSGDAKQEDRKDSYYFMQSISNFLFSQVQKCMNVVSAYLNPSRGTQPIYIVAPKQFDLMSDSDLVNEFASLQGKTDDSQTLSELSYIVNNKIFRDDKVQKKINEVLYYADVLYGVSGNALRTKLLSGVYSELDKVIHEKGYKLLVRMSKEMTEEVFLETETDVLITKLNEIAQSQVPITIYGLT